MIQSVILLPCELIIIQLEFPTYWITLKSLDQPWYRKVHTKSWFRKVHTVRHALLSPIPCTESVCPTEITRKRSTPNNATNTKLHRIAPANRQPFPGQPHTLPRCPRTGSFFTGNTFFSHTFRGYFWTSTFTGKSTTVHSYDGTNKTFWVVVGPSLIRLN